MDVERTPLAPGLEIARILTGLWQVADQERGGSPLDPDAAARAMEPYVDAGLTTFDMADHYGSSEVIAGRLARRRGGVQLLTKWVPEPGPASRETVAEAVARALDRLGSECIDLLQFHPWNYADPGWLDCLFLLAEHQAAGRIRHLGLTNCDAAHLDMAVRSGVPVVSNQVCFSLLDSRAAGAMTDVCRAHGVGLLAYGTLAGGFLSDRWLGREAPPIDESLTWSEMKYRRFIDQAGGWDRFQDVLRAARRVADRLGEDDPDITSGLAEKKSASGAKASNAQASSAQAFNAESPNAEAVGAEASSTEATSGSVSIANVACRHVLEQPAVAGIIVGARLGGTSHIRDNLKLFGISLDEKSRRELDAARARLSPIHGDCGDEYRRPPFLTASGDLSHHVKTFPVPYPVDRSGGVARVSTATPWEAIAGYSRAVRKGNRIMVSGTTANHRGRLIGGRDPAAQTHFIIDKIEGALQSLGASLADVVRTRVFIRDDVDWEPVARAHGVRFAEVLPANTLVRADTVGDDLLVEIEAEAELS